MHQTDPLVLDELRALCSSCMSLDRWTQLADATLQWYCEDSRGEPTEDRNRGEPMRILAAWLYRRVVAHADFYRAYSTCCESRESSPLSALFANALDVQDACNLTGVLYSFLRDFDLLSQEVQRGVVERPLRLHAVVQLYADKICDLAGVKSLMTAGEVIVGR